MKTKKQETSSDSGRGAATKSRRGDAKKNQEAPSGGHDPVVFLLTHLPRVLGLALRGLPEVLIAEFSDVPDATVRAWLQKYRRHARRILGNLYGTVGYLRDFDESETDYDVFEMNLDEIVNLADVATKKKH
jgi:hypothetical protein